MCLDYRWIIWRKYTYIRILHNWIWLLCLSSGRKETNLFSVYWLYVQYSVMETSSWHWDIIPNVVVCFWHYLCAKFYSRINIKKWTQLELFKITGSQTSQTELLSDCQRKSVPVKTSQVALDICHSMLWPLIRFPFLRVSWWELEKSCPCCIPRMSWRAAMLSQRDRADICRLSAIIGRNPDLITTEHWLS